MVAAVRGCAAAARAGAPGTATPGRGGRIGAGEGRTAPAPAAGGTAGAGRRGSGTGPDGAGLSPTRPSPGPSSSPNPAPNGSSGPGPKSPAPNDPAPNNQGPNGPRGFRLAAATAALACLAALTSGCAGQAAGDTGDVPGGRAGAPHGPASRTQAAAVLNAADTLAAAGSSRVATAMRMASGGTWLTVTGTGGFDFARRQGALTVLLPRDAIGKEEHKPITELFVPGALYMKNRGAGVPDGEWVRVDTTGLADGNLVTGGATEPLAAAELLRGARDVRFAGNETVRGVRVRHFIGTTDLVRAAAAAPAEVRAPLAAAARGFTVTRVPFDAWLDAEERLRRLTETFTVGGGGVGPRHGGDPETRRDTDRAVTVVSTTSYDRFGVAVAVTLPRPADIWTGKIVSAQP